MVEGVVITRWGGEKTKRWDGNVRATMTIAVKGERVTVVIPI